MNHDAWLEESRSYRILVMFKYCVVSSAAFGLISRVLLSAVNLAGVVMDGSDTNKLFIASARPFKGRMVTFFTDILSRIASVYRYSAIARILNIRV